MRQGYPELVIPSSEGWGVGLQNRALAPLFFFFFFLVSFCLFFSPYVQIKYQLPYPGHVVALHV